MPGRGRETLLAGATLGLGIVALFLHPADQYFFGDSISTILSRSLNWGAAIRDMARLGGTHWYRPLANGFIQFLLWPLWGLEFAPYHYLAMVMHWAVSFGLFLALRRYLDAFVPALAAAAFYAWHPVAFYASYDICFYQEPMGIGFTFGGVAFFYWYVTRGSKSALALGILSYILAMLTREISVMVPPLLVILLWPRIWTRRAIAVIAATGVTAVAYTATYLFIMHPQLHQPGGYASDWSVPNLAANLWTALRWAFAIPAGRQTSGWQSPGLVQALLWGVLIASTIAATALVSKRPAAWKGLACFCVSAIPALSTHNLLPHHLYLPLMGVALWLGALLTAMPRMIPSAIPVALLLSCVVATSAISARFDSVISWVGITSWETRLPALYAKSALRDLPKWRGVWIVAVDSDPSFSWIYGEMLRLMGTEPLETRLLKARPETAPAGIKVFEYRNAMLTPLEIPATNVAAPRATLRITPLDVHPGTKYRVTVPELAGRSIDLRYSYNEHLEKVAYGFTTLDASGSADIFTPPDTPWGWVDITGVRPSGAIDWSPVRVRVVVLRN